MWLFSSLKLYFFVKHSTNSAAIYDIHIYDIPTHIVLFQKFDFRTSNFGRVDFGEKKIAACRAKKKQKKKTYNPRLSVLFFQVPPGFKITYVKWASDPRTCALLVKDYQILSGYNKWGFGRMCNKTNLRPYSRCSLICCPVGLQSERRLKQKKYLSVRCLVII